MKLTKLFYLLLSCSCKLRAFLFDTCRDGQGTFFRVIPRRMEDPADTMKLASAGGYPGKFSCQFISFSNSRLNLSCLSMSGLWS